MDNIEWKKEDNISNKVGRSIRSIGSSIISLATY
jgi:hypothetical protein